jgi:hypothetical protein
MMYCPAHGHTLPCPQCAENLLRVGPPWCCEKGEAANVQVCPDCADAHNALGAQSLPDCPACSGSGEREVFVRSGGSMPENAGDGYNEIVNCPDCNGSGNAGVAAGGKTGDGTSNGDTK